MGRELNGFVVMLAEALANKDSFKALSHLVRDPSKMMSRDELDRALTYDTERTDNAIEVLQHTGCVRTTMKLGDDWSDSTLSRVELTALVSFLPALIIEALEEGDVSVCSKDEMLKILSEHLR